MMNVPLRTFFKTVTFADGRYMDSWPWRESNPDLPLNYQLAVGRLKSTVMKLVKTPELFKQYNEMHIIQDQLKCGVIEKITSSSPEEALHTPPPSDYSNKEYHKGENRI